MAADVRLRHIRATNEAARMTYTPLVGEWLYQIDTRQWYYGDGSEDAAGVITGTAGGILFDQGTDTNTTYTFENGTAGNFFVTPLGGQRQEVTVGIDANSLGLLQDNIIQDTVVGTRSYDFTSALGMLNPTLTEIPETHFLMLGGLKLLEGTNRDYTISGATVMLSEMFSQVPIVQQLELIVFRNGMRSNP